MLSDSCLSQRLEEIMKRTRRSDQVRCNTFLFLALLPLIWSAVSSQTHFVFIYFFPPIYLRFEEDHTTEKWRRQPAERTEFRWFLHLHVHQCFLTLTRHFQFMMPVVNLTSVTSHSLVIQRVQYPAALQWLCLRRPLRQHAVTVTDTRGPASLHPYCSHQATGETRVHINYMLRLLNGCWAEF